MAVEYAADGPSLVDVLDRVLDKGIVVDAWARVSLIGIDMITIESRVMVASFDTYLRYSEPLRHLPVVAGLRGTVDDGSSFSSSHEAQDKVRHPPSQRPPPRPRTRK